LHGPGCNVVPGQFNVEPANLDAMLPEYYKLRGWSVTGRPSKRKLKKLGLADLTEQAAVQE